MSNSGLGGSDRLGGQTSHQPAKGESEEFEARTGGHWFVKLLQRRGVEFVFGTTGAGMPDIQDAMVITKPPKWIQGLHEFDTVNAAAGYALASGKPGVALIDRVVGTQNAVGAFYGAYLNSAPVVVFASSNAPGVPIPTGETEYHYFSHQELLVDPWVKWSTEVDHLDTLPEDVEKAFFMAGSSHPGPTYVTLRQDLMAQTLEKGRALAIRESNTSKRIPDEETLGRIVKLILEHSNPTLVLSHVGRDPSVVPELVRFAHEFGIGVVERRVFMSFPVDDPSHLDFVSRYTTPELPQGTDLAILLETGLLPHQKFDDRVSVVDLASDPYHRQDVYGGGDYGSSLFPASVRATCDIGPTVSELSRRLRMASEPRDRQQQSERRAKIEREHAVLTSGWAERALDSFTKGTLDGWSIGEALSRQWADGCTWVNGAISPSDGLIRSLRINRPSSYFGNPSGHLGVAVGMAYGVALAGSNYVEVQNFRSYAIGQIKGRASVVVCTVGDGDAIFGNLDAALWTCGHYNIGVVYLILNNASWGIEWPPILRSSQHWARDAADFEFVDLDRPRINFAKIGEAFGVKSYRVTTPSELESVLSESFALARSGRPVVIDSVMEKSTGARESVVP